MSSLAQALPSIDGRVQQRRSTRAAFRGSAHDLAGRRRAICASTRRASRRLQRRARSPAWRKYRHTGSRTSPRPPTTRRGPWGHISEAPLVLVCERVFVVAVRPTLSLPQRSSAGADRAIHDHVHRGERRGGPSAHRRAWQRSASRSAGHPGQGRMAKRSPVAP
jgi:hypothetical protein